jgi:hypothetical protein
MPDTGLVRHIPAHVGLFPTTTDSAFLLGTGKAMAAGSSTTITGTANKTAIFVNIAESEITTATS